MFYDDSSSLSSNYNTLVTLYGMQKNVSVYTNDNTITYSQICTNPNGYGFKQHSEVIAEPIPSSDIKNLFN